MLWNEGKGLELMDPLLGGSRCPDEFLRCYHIGLLCVQEDAFDRSTMSYVIIMLKSESINLWQPEGPTFSVGIFANNQEIASGSSSSVNDLTASTTMPRRWDCSVSLMSFPGHLYLHLVSDNVILLQKHVTASRFGQTVSGISLISFSVSVLKNEVGFFSVISNFIHLHFPYVSEICL